MRIGPTVVGTLVVLATAGAAPRGPVTRALIYPEATVAAQTPPEIRIRADGTPVSLYLPGLALDGRAEVHFVTTPDRLVLRIAEHTAYLHALKAARPGDRAVLTLTLDGGRPLTFTVRTVAEDAAADTSVQIRLPVAPGETPALCEAAVQRVRDELRACLDTDRERGVSLVASLLLDAPEGGEVLETRGLGVRDKQGRIFVEVVDAVRLFGHTYVRLSLENRDGSGKVWQPGEPAVVVEGPGPRRRSLAVVSVRDAEAVETGAAARMVIAVETPQLPKGAKVRLTLPEREGDRHLVLDDLSL